MTGDSSKLFNRPLYQKRRARRAGAWHESSFLKQEAAERLADALRDINRHFPLALDLGSHSGEVAKAIAPQVDKVIRADMLAVMQPQVVCDEEWLPFAENSFDLVVSALSLHHVNDLPGTLIQIQRILKPDGLFLAMLYGASTLRELRASITEASAQHGFALAPRLSPLVEIRDAGALLQRAGFALPVVESDIFTVEYSSVGKLFADLRGMGEANVLLAQHKGFTSRAHMAAIAAQYEAAYIQASDRRNGVTTSEQGRAQPQRRLSVREESPLPATVEFILLSGWKPHASQQSPAQRGSGKVNMRDILK